MASEVHVNDIGTKFLVTIKDDGVAVDISAATNITFLLKRPDDEVIQRAGIIGDGASDTTGVNGKVHYTTVAGDIDEAGHYKLQAKVLLNNGVYYTDIYSFQVHCNL